ncbi:POZ domain-containing protein [Chloropicon primus]|uniref:POZ domain-containing protein n=1 Tax=Chloropicon primus TaxID=1764295 RepID=A0A5B8MRZ6_9CHLO|nr:POZ domain-containing protein [Chloropicon primus]UPR02261.1 POZ domain-containing protein [Chloropicon primus]|eukprot:QDZ23047.1 POZ domain-containing protein [Chloropicon primus]
MDVVLGGEGGSEVDNPFNSKTLTETVVGEHEHTIVGYSLLKGIGDGEPIASDRFTVGGHEWVLLFYPDGKKSSADVSGAHHSHPNLLGHFHHGRPQTARRAQGQPAIPPSPAEGQRDPTARAERGQERGHRGTPPDSRVDYNDGSPYAGAAAGQLTPTRGGDGTNNARRDNNNAGEDLQPQLPQVPPQATHGAHGYRIFHSQRILPHMIPHPHEAPHFQIRRESEVQYAALFVALIGERSKPLGVVQTSEGQIVRAFHHFTLVDQSGGGRDITKGRRREQGAVKISCARQDPNARNCHGYRKFIKRNILENPDSGYLLNDTIKIKYKIELVVMSGGAFCRPDPEAVLPTVEIPEPRLSEDLGGLLKSGENSDFTFVVEGEEMPAHRLIVASRSPVFKALLENDMMEGKAKKIDIVDVRAPAFQILLHFVYTDSLPPEVSGDNLEVTMAQHLLAAADRFELPRLRAICEKHLCETVDIANAATTLTLADENHATELKRHCLEFVAQNLSNVMVTSGFEYMVQRCPHLQRAILEACSKDMSRLPSPDGHGKRRDWDHDQPGSSSKGERRVRFRLK